MDLAGLLGRLVLEPLVDDRGVRGQRDAVQVNDLAIDDQVDVGRVLPAHFGVHNAGNRGFRSRQVFCLPFGRTVDDDARFAICRERSSGRERGKREPLWF